MTFHLVAWAVLLREDGQVLLGRRTGVSYGEGLWGLPGGHVERGEGLREAVAREVWEEMGVRVAVSDLRALGVSRYDLGDVVGTDFLFVCERWEGVPRPSLETSEVGWFPPEALPADSLPWLPGVLRAHLLQGGRVSEQTEGQEGLRVLPQ